MTVEFIEVLCYSKTISYRTDDCNKPCQELFTKDTLSIECEGI